MQADNLIFDVKDQIAYITLNRQHAANGINLPLSKELMFAANECDENPSIRAVVLTGKGVSFCAGGDLHHFAGTSDRLSMALKEMTVYVHSAVSRFTRMNKPLITAVNGVAAGAGMSLAIAGDLIIAAESASFVTAYTAAGLSPDGGMTWLLPRIIGLARAREIISTNRRLTAREAVEWGLINKCVPDEDLLQEVELVAQYFASGPTGSFGKIKQLLTSCFTEPLETQMEMEARGISEMARSRDGMEGVEAFSQKRKPRFCGF